MNATVLVAAGALLGVPAVVSAQTGVIYRLLPQSRLVEVYCLPPCACPYHEMSFSPMAGTFTLTRVVEGPLYTDYSVTSVDWSDSSAVRHVTGSGSYRRGGEVAITQRLQLSLDISGAAWSFDSGTVGQDPAHPFPEISIDMETPVSACRQDQLTLVAEPVTCYPNCDGSQTPPVLNVADFTCFLQHFAGGDPYANCDAGTVPPVLNVADFTCFLQRYAAGCP
jgi:hypothetical protein